MRRYITLYRVENRDDGTSIKYTDHNMMICKENWCIATKVPQRGKEWIHRNTRSLLRN